MGKEIIYIDTEVGIENHAVYDLGALKENGIEFHSADLQKFLLFTKDTDYLCGHNIIHHDLKYLPVSLRDHYKVIDTLYLSPLLFPSRPYHALLKDDKLQSEALNNPLNDAKKAQQLFHDEREAFHQLSKRRKQICCALLHEVPEFRDFFDYMQMHTGFFINVEHLIFQEYEGKICEHAPIASLSKNNPVELAYALALISADDEFSITPRWLSYNYPMIDRVIDELRNTPCKEGCAYCRSELSIHKGLKKIFGYGSFRTYAGEPLQERAAQAAMDGKSLLAVFPTGGGKSITFQLPALMQGRSVHGLTVVISPLQSLMKDQVDHLSELGIVNAVAINGLLSPIERAEALERIESGVASLLYISPEQLRSRTIERILMARNVVRFVIDEAHCFSAWGQDFRVDYLYIGDFISNLQKKKHRKEMIPVSCFTATAKQKVISDIRDYFRRKLNLDLELYTTAAERENLHYSVLFEETESDKYQALRSLIQQKNCPTIVYVSRTRKTKELAAKLTGDGYPAMAYNGQMEISDKIASQDAFLNHEVNIMVATNAFGMGVDKSDVGLVVHYDISDSLENYVQEAGRAGRDPSLQADCYVLFNNNDLDKHFILLNQTKLSIGEIQQVWRAVKELSNKRTYFSCSALEIARAAGWEDHSRDTETRVRSAIAALETAGYVQRGNNVPHVYATSIRPDTMMEAASEIDSSAAFTEAQKQSAKRIIKSLISSRSIAEAGNELAESRVDYLADTLGLEKEEVITEINLMKQEGILEDEMDMSAWVFKGDTEKKSSQALERFSKLEDFVLKQLSDDCAEVDYREWNETALDQGITYSTVSRLKTILYYLTITEQISKEENAEKKSVKIILPDSIQNIRRKYEHRIEICRYIIEYLYQQSANSQKENTEVAFSLIRLLNGYNERPRLQLEDYTVTLHDVSDALLYLNKIGAMRLEGGFLVLYNAMQIKRLITDNRISYKKEDYRQLDEFYQQKVQQIHIVGKYANLLVKNYNAALKFVNDYFRMEYKEFLSRYFDKEELENISRSITSEKYDQLFGSLSEIQRQIIDDKDHKRIVVAAGPGSGKTRVLVHKLASLLMMEDVKHDQLLMLTFSRAAATEFKQRLIQLVGNAAYFVEIKTFHSYCFDLLGQMGTIEKSDHVVKRATEMILNGEVEPSRIQKHVLVIDEAQDMDGHEFALIQALIKKNEDMRIIAVGDDDQNIYSFRGSDSKYFNALISEYNAQKYEMTENYRSCAEIVQLSNMFIEKAEKRMKTLLCTAITEEHGHVDITDHFSRNIEPAIVDQLLFNREEGSTCILTGTNENALQICCLLAKRGVHAKLVQSVNGFRLSNLAEVRYFMKKIDEANDPIITDLMWNRAMDQLKQVYGASSCLNQICRMLNQFDGINPVRYRTDLQEFINESNYEDFYDCNNRTVVVSTMHKAKGKEFDNVYLCLNNTLNVDDVMRRVIYVAMTRAKKNLHIHVTSDIFSEYHMPGMTKQNDYTKYSEPDELLLELGMRDVDLSFIKNKKKELLKLYSGQKLKISGDYLVADYKNSDIPAVRYSKAFREKMSVLKNKGYEIVEARIQFVLAWQGEEDEEESAVILPEMLLRKTEVLSVSHKEYKWNQA